MRLHKLTGSSKQDIEKVGMAVSTDFSIVSFPAFDRNLVDLVDALCLILSTIEVKRSLFLLPKCSGNPRYFPLPPSLAISRQVFISSLVSTGVFVENVMDDLSLFMR